MPFSLPVPRQHGREFHGVLPKVIRRPRRQAMPKRLVVDHETDHAIEAVPHIRLVPDAAAQEHRARACFRGQGSDALDADLPVEAVKPVGRDGTSQGVWPPVSA